MALFFQDEDNIIGTSFIPYVQNVAGLTGVNYRSDCRTKFREERGCSLGRSSSRVKADKPEDPATPIIEAHAGDPVRIHVLGVSNEQNGMFSVEKHEWPIEPFMQAPTRSASSSTPDRRRSMRLFRLPVACTARRRLCVQQPTVAVFPSRDSGDICQGVAVR